MGQDISFCPIPKYNHASLGSVEQNSSAKRMLFVHPYPAFEYSFIQYFSRVAKGHQRRFETQISVDHPKEILPVGGIYS